MHRRMRRVRTFSESLARTLAIAALSYGIVTVLLVVLVLLFVTGHFAPVQASGR